MAMTTNDATAAQRRDIEALLPWHAAGVLSARDAERVEAALASDSELARQYAAVREELGETIRLNETLGAPSVRAMERLMAAIDADAAAARGRRRSFDLGAWIAGHLSRLTPRALAWSAAVAALALVLQAGLIAGLLVDDGGFKTALFGGRSDPGAFVLVGFKPEASAAQITRFLHTHKAVLVHGPEDNALFRLRVADKSLPADELLRISREMQEDSSIVRLAAPTQ
jgi:hypothetical protein